MKILVYPKDSNPYQDYLYKHFSKNYQITYLKHLPPAYIISFLLIPFQLFIYRLKGYQIFHIHWVYTFRIKLTNHFFHSFPFKFIMTIYFLIFLSVIKILGYKIVWTAHDIIPHGNFFIDDNLMSRILANCSDAVIVHSKSSITTMNKLQMNISKTHIIPIGNYISIYENKKSQSSSRSLMKINNQDVVFGFFGKIREDKGIITLIETYVQSNFPNTKLLIAGPCFKYLQDKLRNLAQGRSDIIFDFSFIPDELIQNYINCTDVIIYPFLNITTSSGVVLAMSFSKPVICPLIGDLIDYPKNTGIYYEPFDKNGLKNAMLKAVKCKQILPILGQNGYKFISKFTWDNAAKNTENLYIKLVHI